MINDQVYQIIFDNSEEGIWLIDENSKTVLVNKKLGEILGYAPSEMIGKTIFEFMDKKWIGEGEKQVDRRKERVHEQHEFLLQKKNGSKVWVKLASSSLEDNEGKYIGALALVTDISKSKREEVLLNAQRNIFELLTKGGTLNEALSVLIYAIESFVEGVTGSVLLLDKEGLRVKTGAAPNLPEAFSKKINLCQIGPCAGSCGTAAYRKKIVVVEDIANDILWKDFRDIALENNLRACWSNPIISHKGEVLGTFAMYFNEVRKATEEEINLVTDFTAAARLSIEFIKTREQEKQFKLHYSLLAAVREALVESLHYRSVLKKIPYLLTQEFADWGFISLENDDGVIEIVSVGGRDPKREYLLKQLEGVKPNINALEGLARAMKEKKGLLYSVITEDNLSPSGASFGGKDTSYLELISEIGVKSYIVAPLVVRGSIKGGISIFSSNENRLFDQCDLDLLEQMAKSCSMALDNAILYSESQKTIKAREEFISIVSHELRTPLTSLKLRVDFLSRMIEKDYFPLDIVKILSPIVSEIGPDVNRFTKLINMLLDISKLNSSKMQLDMCECDISQILYDELAGLRAEFQSQKTPLIVEVESGLQGVCDIPRLKQVIYNILLNALKFGRNRTVEFHGKREGKNLVLSIKDQGIGISEEDKKRIFRLFERAVSDKNFGGLGLGLYITLQIVEAYNGEIEVDSKLGEGTTYIVRLPLFTASEHP